MVHMLVNELGGEREWQLSMVSKVSLCAWDPSGTRWDRHGDCDCIARNHSLWRSREGALAHETRIAGTETFLQERNENPHARRF